MRSRVRLRMSYANVVSTVALFVVLGGGAYATIDRKIGSQDLRKGAVTTPKLKKHAVKAGKLAPRSIRTGKIADEAVTEAKLAAGVAVSGPQGLPGPQGEQGPPGPATGPAGGDLTGNYPDPLIGAGAVTSGKLANLAVTMPKLANLAVATEKLANAAVTAEKLANLAVTMPKLANLAVATEKLANAAVTAEKLADDSIGTEKLIDGSVGLADLAANSVDSGKVVDNSLTGDDVAPAAIGSGQLAPNAINSSALVAPNAIRYSDYAKLVLTNHGVDIPNIAGHTCIIHNFANNATVNALDVVQPLPPANPEHLGLVYYPARTIVNNQAQGYVCNVTAAAINPPNTGFDLVVYNRP